MHLCPTREMAMVRRERVDREKEKDPSCFLPSLYVMDLGVQVGLEMYIGGSIVIDCSKSYEIT